MQLGVVTTLYWSLETLLRLLKKKDKDCSVVVILGMMVLIDIILNLKGLRNQSDKWVNSFLKVVRGKDMFDYFLWYG